MRSPTLPNLAVIFILFLTFIALVLYALTLRDALKKCGPVSRTMKPGMVWLILIPAFGLIWQFIVVLNVTASLGNEFARLEIPRPEPSLGRTAGLAMCVCNCCIFIPTLGRLISIAGFILWIVFWKRIAKYSQRLDAHRTVTPPMSVA